MAVSKSATYTTPDGVERTLRFTKASQFRISTLSEKHGGTPDYLIAWSMMFDEDGNPPKFPEGHPRAGQAMSADWLGANLSPTDTPKLLSAISEATTGTGIEKKTLETLEKLATAETQKLSGLIAGLSLELLSALPEAPPSSERLAGEFWWLTPREFESLQRRYAERERDANFRAGVIASAPFNAQRTKASQRYLTWKDFFNDPIGPPEEKEPEMLSAEELLEKMDKLFPPVN